MDSQTTSKFWENHVDRYQRQIHDLLDRAHGMVRSVNDAAITGKLPKDGTFEADNMFRIRTLTRSVIALEAAVRSMVEQQEAMQRKEHIASLRVKKEKKSGVFSWPR